MRFMPGTKGRAHGPSYRKAPCHDRLRGKPEAEGKFLNTVKSVPDSPTVSISRGGSWCSSGLRKRRARLCAAPRPAGPGAGHRQGSEAVSTGRGRSSHRKPTHSHEKVNAAAHGIRSKQKPTVFLHGSNEQIKKEMINTIPLTKISRHICLLAQSQAPFVCLLHASDQEMGDSDTHRRQRAVLATTPDPTQVRCPAKSARTPPGTPPK